MKILDKFGIKLSMIYKNLCTISLIDGTFFIVIFIYNVLIRFHKGLGGLKTGYTSVENVGIVAKEEATDLYNKNDSKGEFTYDTEVDNLKELLSKGDVVGKITSKK